MSINKINDLSLHNHAISSRLHEAARRVIDSGWYAMGPEVTAFEGAFADYCGVGHAIGVANGTDAIELALRAVGVKAGDEVITVANAGFYSSTAIRAIGATAVYVDICDVDLLMDAAAAAAAITAKTKAIIVTHLFGQLADMEPLQALARTKGVALVEDCAQSHGAVRDNKKAGSYGDVAAFSFFPTKNLGALGDGGAVVTANAELAARVRSLRQYGWTTKYTVADSGACNSRLDELQAALLAVKLPLLDSWNEKRRKIAERYAEKIQHTAIRLPAIRGEDNVAHLYVIRCQQRDALKKHLHDNGIATDIHYPILDCHQPVVGSAYTRVSLPISEKVRDEILTLPCYPELTLEEVDTIANCINRWGI
ncbi:MAG TPA: DegT/DnrJ/EryC1/StrS family aminotransferase [Pseudomonadales bacterium]|nr:DegT/DnrJ/EryC1/StrS family aminotransferase [Pseudomonadales bacterium]